MPCPVSSTKDGSGFRNLPGSHTSVPPWGVLPPLFHFHLRPSPRSPSPAAAWHVPSGQRTRLAKQVCIASDAEQWGGTAASAGGPTVRRHGRQRVGYGTVGIRSRAPPARLVPRPCRRGPDGEDRRGRAVHEVLHYHVGTRRIDCGIGRK